MGQRVGPLEESYLGPWVILRFPRPTICQRYQIQERSRSLTPCKRLPCSKVSAHASRRRRYLDHCTRCVAEGRGYPDDNKKDNGQQAISVLYTADVELAFLAHELEVTLFSGFQAWHCL